MLHESSPECLLLARIRDEAHRHAITFHRARRSKRTIRSALESIPGLGPRRATALLAHFGSVRKLREASLDAIAGVPGFGERSAHAVYEALHPGESDPPGPGADD
jgi:excinuclease ABC subunit C